AIFNAVEFDVIDAPFREPIHPRVGVLLRSGLAVVDADHALAVVVFLRMRWHRNLVNRIARTFNRGFFAYCLLRNTRRHVDSELHPEAVKVVSDYLDAVGISLRWESQWVCHPAAIRVDVGTLRPRTLVPKIIDVYVVVPEFLQAGVPHCTRLSFDIRCRGILPDEAPATPAENGCALETMTPCRGILLPFRSASARQQCDDQRSRQGMCQLPHEGHSLHARPWGLPNCGRSGAASG